MSRAQVGDAGHVFGSLLLKTFYPLPWKNIDLAFITVNEKPGIILTPLASALDCGSEGLKSSAPSSTRFSSSSDEQEKGKLAVSHTRMLLYNPVHIQKWIHVDVTYMT